MPPTPPVSMHDDISEVLFTEDRIRGRIRELGQEIARHYAGRELRVMAMLKGGVVFIADLIREIPIPLHLDFIWASSYGAGTTSSGTVQLRVFPEEDVRGRDLLVIDDILDTGRTLSLVVGKLRTERGAREIRTCVLLDKRERRQVDLEADWVGFRSPDRFVVGYGLDYADRYRNLPYIGVLRDGCCRT